MNTLGACSATELSRPPAQLAGSLPVSWPGQKAPGALPTTEDVPYTGNFISSNKIVLVVQHNRNQPSREIAERYLKTCR
jgi:hypothetical protein